jgi:predicted unusual protein kinase regulating ubiquinone biosynthesis (AarF/ABC1/UbiB family)
MWSLCSDLRSFYTKVGQLVAMQGFVPPPIREKLSRLQDSMPPLPGPIVRALVEREVRCATNGARGLDDVFAALDLERVLGCASIAQVHRGTLRDGGVDVAVKLQMPDAEAMMASDLGNFRLLAEVLQRTELKFDLVGPLKELSAQLGLEFDFLHEARSQDSIGRLLARVKGIRVPKPFMPLVTRRMLVMEVI